MSSKKTPNKGKTKQRSVVQDPNSVSRDMMQMLLDNSQQTTGFSRFANTNAFAGMFGNVHQQQSQNVPHYHNQQSQNVPLFPNQQSQNVPIYLNQLYQNVQIHPNHQQTKQTPYYPSLRDESSDEEVPETPLQNEPESEPEPEPESEPKGKGKGKVVEKKVRCPKTAWTDLETKILAERFVYVSEHPSVGNDQSHTSFWGEVRRRYNSIVPVKRRPDQISGKWSKMQRDVKIWIGIYNKYERMWESGCHNDDIMSAARMAFKAQTKGRHFAFEDAWRVLRNCPKFLEGESISSSNKRKEPDHIPINDQTEGSSNPNTSMHPDPTQMKNLLKDTDPIRRPPSRAKSQRDSYSSDVASRMSSDEVRFKIAQSVQASQDVANQTMKKLQDDSNMRTMFKGLKLLSKPVSRDLPPDEYDMLMLARDKIKKKYAKKLQNMDDDDEE